MINNNSNFQKYLAEVEKTGKLKNKELYFLALNNGKKAIKYIPYDEQTAEMALMAVNKNPHSLGFVAPQLRTAELCLLAIEKNVNSIKHVPDELKSLELCFLAISKNPRFLRNVPNELKNLELCKLALKNNSSDEIFKTIPEKYRKALFKVRAQVYGKGIIYNCDPYNESIYSQLKSIFNNMLDNLTEEDVKKELELKYVGVNNQTEKIVIELFNKYGCDFPLSLVDEHLKNEKICLLAINKNFSNARFIPKNLRTLDFYQKALSINGRVWRHIPKNIRTKDLALLALKSLAIGDISIIKLLRDMPDSYFKDIDFYNYNLQILKCFSIALESDLKIVYFFKNMPEKIKKNEDFQRLTLIGYKNFLTECSIIDPKFIYAIVNIPRFIWSDDDIYRDVLEKIKKIIENLADNNLEVFNILSVIPEIFLNDNQLYNLILNKYNQLLLMPVFRIKKWSLLSALNIIPKCFFNDADFCQSALTICIEILGLNNCSTDNQVPIELRRHILLKSDKKQALSIFYKMRNQEITKNICHIMIDKGYTWYDLWNAIPAHIKDENICYEAIESGVSLDKIPESSKTDKLCLLALEKDEKTAIFYVPEKFQTIEKLLFYVKSLSHTALANFCRNLPKELQNVAFGKQLLIIDCGLINYLPLSLKTKELYDYIIVEKEYIGFFRDMPNELKTTEICWFCIKKDIRLANYIPSHCVTKDLLMYLIAEDAAIWMFKNIPLDLITQELCDSVIRKSPSHFEYIPDQFKTPEMCWLAVNYRSNALQFVP